MPPPILADSDSDEDGIALELERDHAPPAPGISDQQAGRSYDGANDEGDEQSTGSTGTSTPQSLQMTRPL